MLEFFNNSQLCIVANYTKIGKTILVIVGTRVTKSILNAQNKNNSKVRTKEK